MCRYLPINTVIKIIQPVSYLIISADSFCVAVCVPQICGSFSARAGVQGHIKMHHAHTNVIGLGDSSVWKVPFLPRTIYLFVAPLAVPIITPLVALGKRRHRPGDGL